MTGHTDALDRPIKVGDSFVRFCERAGSVVMDAGRVTALVKVSSTFTSRDGQPAIEAVTCRGGWSPRLHKGGKPVTIELLGALVVVDQLPAWATELLGARGG